MSHLSRAMVVLSLIVAGQAQAQSSSGYHPFLTDSFNFSAGAFFPTQGLDLSADGTIPGEDIDFDETLGVDDSSITPAVSFRWSFTEKWSLWGQWWKTDNSGSATLGEDVTWNDLTFEAGSNVEAGVETTVARVFLGREIWSGPQFELGLGLGVHWLDISAYVEGEAITSGGSTGFQRGDASISAPLPNIGGWYYFSPSAQWLISANVDWFSASVGDYDGSLWDASVGVNYQFARHFGLNLSYQFFSLDVEVDNTDWNGSANIKNDGPLLALTANW